MNQTADKFTKLYEAIDACADRELRTAALRLLDDLQCDEPSDPGVDPFDEVVARFVANADDHEGMFDAIVRVAFPK